VEGKNVRGLSGHEERPAVITFSPDGKLLASAANDGIRVWDPKTAQELKHFQGAPFSACQLAISPDGKMLAAACAPNAIQMWEIATGKEIQRWDAEVRWAMPVLFSPDGKFLAFGDVSGVCHVRDIATGKERFHFGGPDDYSFLAFSPSGRTLAGGVSGPQRLDNGDVASFRRVHLWDLVAREEIRQIDLSQGSLGPLAFAPDGRTLASGGGNSTILLWDLTDHAGKPKPAPLTPAQLDELWLNLIADAPKADRAIWSLAFAPQQSVPFLKARLEPVAPRSAEQIAHLIADLDDQRFPVRQKAAQALEALHDTAERTIRKTLAANPTLEVRQRLEQILEKGNKETIRKLRAIEALEHIGTPEARQVLQTLAERTPNPRLAEAAQAARQRLQQRP
jgi:dipeptidyl aminopeptidase/acylaminoacyl peptidase